MADWLVYNQRVEAYGWGLYLSGFFMELPLVGKIRRPMVWLAGGFGNGDCGTRAQWAWGSGAGRLNTYDVESIHNTPAAVPAADGANQRQWFGGRPVQDRKPESQDLRHS